MKVKADTGILLCVGGPADGRTLAVDPKAHQVWIPLRMGAAKFTYVRQQWGTPTERFELLAPEGQEPAETFRLLLAGYGPGRPR